MDPEETKKSIIGVDPASGKDWSDLSTFANLPPGMQPTVEAIKQAAEMLAKVKAVKVAAIHDSLVIDFFEPVAFNAVLTYFNQDLFNSLVRSLGVPPSLLLSPATHRPFPRAEEGRRPSPAAVLAWLMEAPYSCWPVSDADCW